MSPASRHPSAVAAYVAAATNLLASLAMALWLSPGLPLPGSSVAASAAYRQECVRPS